MLDGNKLIIRPIEGGGFEVHEVPEPVTVNDIVNTVGSVVVTLAVVGAVCWMMDKITKSIK